MREHTLVVGKPQVHQKDTSDYLAVIVGKLINFNNNPNVMHCCKLKQIVTSLPGSEQPPVQLVSGVCDYIPCSLKQNGSLRISIDGDYQTIVNSVLWSEFFSKTLLK